jgi:hypothetical protein
MAVGHAIITWVLSSWIGMQNLKSQNSLSLSPSPSFRNHLQPTLYRNSSKQLPLALAIAAQIG